MDTATIWLILGAVMIALEAFTVPGIGLFFGGLAGIVVGGLILAGLLGVDQYTWQISCWFILTVITAMLLWKPMQRFRVNKHADGSFNNIVGTHAKVVGESLKSGTTGKVSWSGTTMNARLESSGELPVGTEVIITKIEGNTVTVKPAAA